MNKDYYKEYYHLERKHWWFTVRAEILSETIQRKISKGIPLKILNVGVATGATSEMLKNFGDVVSVEYDTDCCAFLREQNVLPEVVQGSILELEYADNSFDLVCAFDVIEHVEDDVKALSEMERVCKKDGHVFVTVPAFMFLWSQHDVVNFHYRRYTKQNLLKAFNDGHKSSSIVYSTYFNSILFLPIASFRLAMKLVPLSIQNRKGAGSDFSFGSSDGFVNKFMGFIFRIEKRLLIMGLRFPFGVSIMAISRKS